MSKKKLVSSHIVPKLRDVLIQVKRLFLNYQSIFLCVKIILHLKRLFNIENIGTVFSVPIHNLEAKYYLDK